MRQRKKTSTRKKTPVVKVVDELTPQQERQRVLEDGDPWSTPAMIEAMEERKRYEADQAGLRRDGYYRNEVSGIGAWERDKTFGGYASGPTFYVHALTAREVEDRWRGNDFGQKIVQSIPEEMTREGFDVIISPTEDGDATEGPEEEDEEGEDEETQMDAFPPGAPGASAPGAPGLMPIAPPKPKAPMSEIDDESARIAEEIEGKLDKLDASAVLFQALCYDRAYGGAAIFVGLQGEGGDAATGYYQTPVDETKIQDVTHLIAFQGGWDGEITAWSYYGDPLAKNYGKPMIYMLRPSVAPIPIPVKGQKLEERPRYAGQVIYVHESRFLVPPVTAPSRRSLVEQRGWTDGVFSRVDKILSDYDQSWGGIAITMQELNLYAFGIKELFAKQAAEKGKGPTVAGLIRARMQQVQMTKSVARGIAHDADGEKVANISAQLGGVGEVLDRFASRMAAALDMSKAELFGEDTGGLAADGSGMRYKNNKTRARQTRLLLPMLKKLVRWIFLSKQGPTKGVEPERWRIKFRPLWQPTEQEIATTRKTVAETDKIYIDAGVLEPNEVAASAYGGSEWSMERQIDFEGREAMAAEEAARAAEMKAQMQPAAGAEKPLESEQAPPSDEQAPEDLNKPKVE